MVSSGRGEDRSPQETASPPSICDYEGSSYRTEFWTQARTYEDAAERIALEALLPPTGHRLIEIGAGFGRLVDLYAGYDQVVLFELFLWHAIQANRDTQCIGPLKLKPDELLIPLWHPPIDFSFEYDTGFYAHRVPDQRFTNHRQVLELLYFV